MPKTKKGAAIGDESTIAVKPTVSEEKLDAPLKTFSYFAKTLICDDIIKNIYLNITKNMFNDHTMKCRILISKVH